MPYYQARHRAKMEALWADAVGRLLASIRAETAAAPAEAQLPSSILVAEAIHHFDRSDLWPVEQWFRCRLNGSADTEEEREALAAALASEAANRPSQRVPLGFATGEQNRERSRRAAP